MSWPVGKPTGLEGIVPDTWLRRERWLRESDLVMAILHPEPAALGHSILYPKKHSPRAEDSDPALWSAVGMIVPELKRAIRLITGYRDYALILRSGKTAGQMLDHIYFELIPTIHTKPTFKLDWDPHNKKGKGENDLMTKKTTFHLVSMLRREMGMHHFDGFGCVLLESERMTVEFVDMPASTGHMIISPKELSPDFEDCNPIDLAACLWQIPNITRALKNTINLENFIVIVLNGPDAGQSTAHLSVQLVPCSRRGASVIFEQKVTVKPTRQTEVGMVNAIKQILGQEIVTLALGSTSAPRESAWPRPISREGTNPVGTASPALIRARSPHPSLDGWARNVKTGKRPDATGSMRPGSTGSVGFGSEMSFGSRPPSRLATPGSLSYSRSSTPADAERGMRDGVFQRSAQHSMTSMGTAGMRTQHRPPSRLSVLSGASSRGSYTEISGLETRQQVILREIENLLS
jgi:diadenosine tetraphosphate (Ap4A) HIT family hydrolase